MEGDRYFIDFVGKRNSTVRGLVRWGETFYCVRDFCAAARLNLPKSVKNLLHSGERIRTTIDRRYMVLVSAEGLIGLIPNKPEFFLARNLATELIKRSEIKLEPEVTQDEQQ
jgi:hypothetical protein